MQENKKIYDCYSRLITADSDDYIPVTVIRNGKDFDVRIGENEYLKDMSDFGLLNVIQTYTPGSIKMVFDELRYIPNKFFKDEEETHEFVTFIKGIEKKMVFVKAELIDGAGQ